MIVNAEMGTKLGLFLALIFSAMDPMRPIYVSKLTTSLNLFGAKLHAKEILPTLRQFLTSVFF